jgi:NADPH:quinone reductase-like Zn-dependent oxidoreductase
MDFAGVVEAVGTAVDQFAPGDEVFGCADGAFAEYVTVRRAVHLKPRNVSFEEAAAVSVAALTALQGLRDHGAVGAGTRVLVNGAAGGVGTFAVQIAKALGAEVDAVCSARNVEQTRRLGAGRVFDYEREDFTRSGTRYDVLFDNAGSRSWRAMCRVLTSTGTVVHVGGSRNRVVGPLAHVGASLIAAKLSSRRAVFFIAKSNREDLATLALMIENGEITPLVERSYGIDEIRAAFAHLATAHARAKLVVTTQPPASNE